MIIQQAQEKYIKTITILLVVLIILLTKVTYAQTPTSTTSSQLSPTTIADDLDIQNLKDKIATKVAELTKDKNNKAISGLVKSINNNLIIIINENEEEYEVKPDDVISKYYQISGVTKKEIKFNDLKKDMFLIVTGVLNDKTITANTVYVDEMFLVKSGKVTLIDKEKFSLNIVTTEKDTMTLEIETSTKQYMLNVKTLDVEKSGFSKIKEGDTIHFVVKRTGNEKNNIYSANKILIIPQEYFMK